MALPLYTRYRRRFIISDGSETPPFANLVQVLPCKESSLLITPSRQLLPIHLSIAALHHFLRIQRRMGQEEVLFVLQAAKHPFKRLGPVRNAAREKL